MEAQGRDAPDLDHVKPTPWKAAVLIVLVALAAYANSFPGAFVFDDESSILENDSIRQLWPPSAVLSPPVIAGVHGRPLTNLTYALNYAAGGLDPAGFRAVNLAIHILAALVLFGLVRRTLLLPAFRDRAGCDALLLALAASALWVLHPVQTIAVDYISQRVESLMALGYLATLYGFVRHVEGGRRRWAIFSVAACLLGMASKEVIVTAPVLVLFYDRAFVAGTFRDALRARWKLHAALGAVAIACVALSFSGQLAERGVGFGLGVSPIDYALTECRAIWIYLGLAVWPSPLVFDYGWDFVRSAREAAPYAVALAALLGLGAFAFWKKPRLGFAAAWFFIILAPTSSIVPIIQQPVAENRMYLPLAIVPALAALALHRLDRRALLACVPVAVAFGWLTHARNQDYRSALALWSDTMAKRPENARAHNNLGSALVAAGRLDDAIAHFQTAAKLQPGYPEPLNNLGAALVRAARARDAIAPLEQALRVRADFADAHYNLGEAFMLTGRTAEAVAEFSTAIAQNPRHAQAHSDLSVAFLQTGRANDAAVEAEAAIRLRPEFAPAHYNLGLALLQTGRAREAVEQFSATLRLDPTHEAARRHLERARALLPPSP